MVESRSLERGGITVRTLKGAILTATELHSAEEICFGNNQLSLLHEQFCYSFSALEALSLVDPTGQDGLQVAHAKDWAKSRNLEETEGVKVIQKWDWTYTTLYEGTFVARTPGLEFVLAPPSHPGIPLKRLASQEEPILFFDEVSLFEDELHDCGMASLTAKVRVMPSFVFVLSRFFLRVDRVIFRIFDVRLYHAFGSKEIVREIRGREAPYEEVKRRLPPDKLDDLSPLTDATWVANVLGLLEDSRPASTAATSVYAGVRDYLAGPGGTSSRRRATSAALPMAQTDTHWRWKGQLTRLDILTLPS